MKGMWTFGGKHGKERGLLALYILHSLHREPKSGYDLLKEIGQKTEGTWIPSKGTLYPVLKQLEAEELIYVCRTEKRSRTIFRLTEHGLETLRIHREHGRESREKMLLLRNLIVDIFHEEGIASKELAFEIRGIVDELSPEKEEEAARILERCRAELQRIT